MKQDVLTKLIEHNKQIKQSIDCLFLNNNYLPFHNKLINIPIYDMKFLSIQGMIHFNKILLKLNLNIKNNSYSLLFNSVHININDIEHSSDLSSLQIITYQLFSSKEKESYMIGFKKEISYVLSGSISLIAHRIIVRLE